MTGKTCRRRGRGGLRRGARRRAAGAHRLAEPFDRTGFFAPAEFWANVRNASPDPAQAGRQRASAARSLRACAAPFSPPAPVSLSRVSPHRPNPFRSGTDRIRILGALPFRLAAPCGAFVSHFAPPMRGVRSAVGAWMPATHPDRHAMTGVQTPLSNRRGANPPCVHCAPRANPACVRFARAGRPCPACVEASCVTRRRERSPFGAPRGISGPGPCLPLSRLR
jgi:hypothetical protein